MLNCDYASMTSAEEISRCNERKYNALPKLLSLLENKKDQAGENPCTVLFFLVILQNLDYETQQ